MFAPLLLHKSSKSMRPRYVCVCAVAALGLAVGFAPAHKSSSQPHQSSSPLLQLWYWHHSYLANDAALTASKALVDKAAGFGYNGVAIWDSSFSFMGDDWWPKENEARMAALIQYAHGKHMKVFAMPDLFGMSNDVLEANPNWAEGIRVTGTQFTVDRSGKRLNLQNSFPGLANPSFEDGKTAWFDTGDQAIGINPVAHSGKNSAVIVDAPANARLRQAITLKPWRAYHLQLFYKSSGFRGSAAVYVFDRWNSQKTRLDADLKAAGNHDWTEADYLFNSQDTTNAYIYLGVWGGSSGVLWFDDVQIEETALVYLLRRPGAPLKVYDANHPDNVYQEGVDFEPIVDTRMKAGMTFADNYHDPAPVLLRRGTHLRPGQTVAIDSYSAFPIPGLNSVSLCMTEPDTFRWMERNAKAIARIMPPDGGFILSYDEIRQANSCASCRAKHMSAGELMDWSLQQSLQIYRSAMPRASFYTWSDMFDPAHNAHDHYYYVEGDFSGSWTGLPRNLTILNWNVDNLKPALVWFSGLDPRQPVAFEQVIAGFYDRADGAAEAQKEVSQAMGIPGIKGFLYTTWNDNYSQLEGYAKTVRAGWNGYLTSVRKRSGQ